MPRDLNALALPDLFAELARTGLVRRAIELSRDEDLGDAGDVTSEVFVPSDARAVGRVVAREGLVVAGLAALGEVKRSMAPRVAFETAAVDGARVAAGTLLAELRGPMREILAAERTLLNLVGRLSGIAGLTAQYVEAVRGTGAQVFDTRKTTPGLRALEKYAVRCGGGRCHRLGLYDAVLIKDNHLAGVAEERLGAAVRAAAAAARARPGGVWFVEVEVATLEQLRAILDADGAGADIVLLDNMSLGQLREAVAMRDRWGGGAGSARLLLEASGGVRLETIRAIAETGVERISAGALTHRAVSADVAMDVERI
jgi:nicotinate-nucleotide pyrophosphorylase (carboxylating)